MYNRANEALYGWLRTSFSPHVFNQIVGFRRMSRNVLRGNASNHHHDEGNAKIKKHQVLLSKINLTVKHTFWKCFAITAQVTLSNLQE